MRVSLQGFYLALCAWLICAASAYADPFASAALSVAIKVDRDFTENTILDLDELNRTIYSLSISGQGFLGDQYGFQRVVLVAVDKNGDRKDYLVYDMYSQLQGGKSGLFHFDRHCEETCTFAEGVTPLELKIITLGGGAISLREILFTDDKQDLPAQALVQGGAAYAQELRLNQVIERAEKINMALGQTWVAGPTSVSGLTHNEKKELSGGSDLSAAFGMDLYQQGIFPIPDEAKEEVEYVRETLRSPRVAGAAKKRLVSPPSGASVATQMAPSTTILSNPGLGTPPWPPIEFSWLHRHGRNWLTAVRDQGYCGSCWAFAAVGAIEAVTNLCFNQLLNYDLSEQQSISCANLRGCGGGWPHNTTNYSRLNGIWTEDAQRYRGVDASGCNAGSCNPASAVTCESRSAPISITVWNEGSTYFNTIPQVQEALINYGPLAGCIMAGWSHAMTLVGWRTIQAGDRIYNESGYSSGRQVQSGDPLIGKLLWHFKNSWGTGWGENGYIRLYYTNGTTAPLSLAISGPMRVVGANVSTTCTDEDKDGICFWGICGGKPSNCPASCEGVNVRDFDDGDPTVGPSPGPPTPTPTNTSTPPTIVTTSTPTPIRTSTPVAPTVTATNTPLPPTSTSTPTRTPVPPTPTATNTATAVPPTRTSTATPVPPTNTPTQTPLPPTATSTATSLPPTATATSTPTSTPELPTPTPTETPRDKETPTPESTPSSTPTPTPTDTPSSSGLREGTLVVTVITDSSARSTPALRRLSDLRTIMLRVNLNGKPRLYRSTGQFQVPVEFGRGSASAQSRGFFLCPHKRRAFKTSRATEIAKLQFVRVKDRSDCRDLQSQSKRR
jgi:hypothetical protein